jgi:hypothetical protein
MLTQSGEICNKKVQTSVLNSALEAISITFEIRTQAREGVLSIREDVDVHLS